MSILSTEAINYRGHTIVIQTKTNIEADAIHSARNYGVYVWIDKEGDSIYAEGTNLANKIGKFRREGIREAKILIRILNKGAKQ